MVYPKKKTLTFPRETWESISIRIYSLVIIFISVNICARSSHPTLLLAKRKIEKENIYFIEN